MVKLNLATMPQRAKAWAIRCLRAGMKPADVTRLTGVEIRTQDGDTSRP